MKTFSRHYTQKSITLLASMTLIFAACGKKVSGGKQSQPVPVPQLVAEPVKPAAEIPKQEIVKALKFTETNVDLIGDFRIKKIVKDAQGNYYVAFVSDVKIPNSESVVPGYTLMKFSSAGSEMWRFPTAESAEIEPNSANKVGSYLIGALADFDVSPTGEVYLFGLKKSKVNLSEQVGLTEFDSSKWTATKLIFTTVTGTPRTDYFGNVAFLTRIRGGGETPDSPIASFHAELPAPIWWSPDALSLQPDGSVVIESSNGLTNSGVVRQVQQLSSSLDQVEQSACFVAFGSAPSAGIGRQLSIAVAASEPLVTAMTKPLSKDFQISDKTNLDEYRTLAQSSLLAESGRCWDLFSAVVMPNDDIAFKIVKPSILAAGQPMSSRVESLSDLLSGKNEFEEYDVINPPSTWSANVLAPIFDAQFKQIESARPHWAFVGDELVHFGFGKADIFGQSSLLLGNSRSLATKTWEIALQTNSRRYPASLDVFDSDKNGDLYVAWTDLHLAGETNAYNRALRIAAIPKDGHQDAAVKTLELEAPKETGHSSFSSVHLSDDKDGSLVVFATVGTRDTNSKPEEAIMKQATLIIGFMK